MCDLDPWVQQLLPQGGEAEQSHLPGSRQGVSSQVAL